MSVKVKQKIILKRAHKKLLELYRVRSEIQDLWQKSKLGEVAKVGRNDVAGVVSRMTGIPLSDLTEEEKIKLINIEQRLAQRVVGQNQAVELVSHAIRRARAGLKDLHRPIGTFLFLGPSGVGKTELAKTLAEVLYGSEEALIRLDMSEYMEKHTVSRLIGAPPGYVGFDEGGQLTEMIRRRPFSIILLDEIEKAHPEVFNVLLQVMEEGELTDGQGHVVSFRNCIIIMTSNAGSEMIYDNTLGFSPENSGIKQMPSYEELKDKVTSSLKEVFRPEFLNRIDEIVVFRALGKEDLAVIARLELGRLQELLSEQKLSLQYGKKVVAWLTEKGYDPQYGARPIKRLIQREIENLLSAEIIKGSFVEGGVVKLNIDKGIIEVLKHHE